MISYVSGWLLALIFGNILFLLFSNVLKMILLQLAIVIPPIFACTYVWYQSARATRSNSQLNGYNVRRKRARMFPNRPMSNVNVSLIGLRIWNTLHIHISTIFRRWIWTKARTHTSLANVLLNCCWIFKTVSQLRSASVYPAQTENVCLLINFLIGDRQANELEDCSQRTAAIG